MAEDEVAASQILAALSAIEGRLDAMDKSLISLRKTGDIIQRLTSPFGVYLGDDIVLTQMLSGLRFMVPASDSVMAPKMIGNRIWEPRITARLPELLRRDKDFIDIGANVGYFSLSVGNIIGKDGGGVVYAFEPNPQIFSLLQKNIQINWSLAPVHARQIALGAETGRMTLHLPGTLASNASLLDKTGKGAFAVTAIPVDVIPFDDLGIAPDRIGLIKIDVEGAEAMVVRGATRTLSANPDIEIIMEWDIRAQSYNAGGTEWLIQYFSECGFRAYTIEDGMAERPIADLATLSYGNLFLSRRKIDANTSRNA